MDEYVGLPPTHSASFQRYMRERVAARLPFREFHYLTGDTGDAQAEADRYAALLRAHPLDLCCCGIGENGHLAFNDPPVADFDDPADVKIVALEHASRRQQVAEGHFATVDDVPTHAITVTIPALAARRPGARDRARGAQGRAGARRARGPDHHCVPGVVPPPPAARDPVPRRGVGVTARARDRERRDGGRTKRTIRAGAAVPEPAGVRPPLPAARRRACSSSGSRSRSRCAPQLGVAPWDVFHQGVAKAANISLGVVVVLVGLVVLLAWIPLRQHLGIGTILNTLSIGFIANLGLALDPEPARDRRSRIAFLAVAIAGFGLGGGLYIGSRVSGPGPATV